MEEKATVPDRRLLARLVLVREEARSLLSGGLLDERNDRTKFRNLPEPEVGQEQHIKLFSLPYLTGVQEVNEAVVNTHFHCS
jgi:hypothetical protein